MRSSSVQHFILELLKQEHTHYTAQEIYTHLKERLPSVNPSTVYRALDRLANAGEVSVSDMGTGAAVYELVGASPHHHLVCQNCNKVITLENELIQPLFDKVAGEFDYTLTTNHMILFGLCPKCAEEQG